VFWLCHGGAPSLNRVTSRPMSTSIKGSRTRPIEICTWLCGHARVCADPPIVTPLRGSRSALSRNPIGDLIRGGCLHRPKLKATVPARAYILPHTTDLAPCGARGNNHFPADHPPPLLRVTWVLGSASSNPVRFRGTIRSFQEIDLRISFKDQAVFSTHAYTFRNCQGLSQVSIPCALDPGLQHRSNPRFNRGAVHRRRR